MFNISAGPKKKLTRDLSCTEWMLFEEQQQNSTFSHLTLTFLSRVSILTRDIDIANLSVCPFVCPSVRYIPVPDENGFTYRYSFFHHTVAQSFCFYQHQTSSRNSDGVTPAGVLNTGGV